MEIGNKRVFANNLQHYMDVIGKSRKEVCSDLGIAYSTFTEWCAGKKYPRIDKIEMLADYFGIQKSDLIEDKLSTPSSGYYTNSKTAEIAEQIYQNKQLGMVFDALADSTPEQIKNFYDVLMVMKRTENHQG